MVRFPGTLIRLGRLAAQGMPSSAARSALQVMPGSTLGTLPRLPGRFPAPGHGDAAGRRARMGTEPPASLGGGMRLLCDTKRPGRSSDSVFTFVCRDHAGPCSGGISGSAVSSSEKGSQFTLQKSLYFLCAMLCRAVGRKRPGLCQLCP